jgi:hypothetical protein
MIKGKNPSRDIFAKFTVTQDTRKDLPSQDNNETGNLEKVIEFLQTRPDYQEWLESRKTKE